MSSGSASESDFRVFVSIASNILPERNITASLDVLRTEVRLCGLSTFFRTAAIERPEQPEYLNGVALITTAETPHHLKFGILRKIETSLGRVRGADKYAARPIDLDILLYGDLVLHDESMVLPDRDIYTRPFLAAGILELDPDIVVPGTGRFLRSLMMPDALSSLAREGDFTRRLKERYLE